MISKFKNQTGFTLIELLVVVGIIGILAAIAIPQFANYKIRSFNARAQSDLKNALSAEEAYFVDNEQYTACNDGDCPTNLPGLILSDGVRVSIVTNADASAIAGTACHIKGDQDYNWNADTNLFLQFANAGTCSPAVVAPH